MCTICRQMETLNPVYEKDALHWGYVIPKEDVTYSDIPASPSTPASISIGGTYTGTLETRGDRDWVKIDLTSGVEYKINLDGHGSLALRDPYLRIYDSSGNLVTENDDSAGTFNSEVQFTAGDTGSYYIEAAAYSDFFSGDYIISAEEISMRVYSNDEIADQLTDGYWGGNVRSFNITNNQLTYNLTGLTSEGQTLARDALALWADAIGITFVETTQAAQITFDDNQSGAYASTTRSGSEIISANINIGTGWLASYGTDTNSYSFQTYIHEIGHALGLGHAGNYNGAATYGVDNDYLNDSWQASVMSYFSQTENTYIDANYAFVVTPQIADLIAIHNLYGASQTTRTGDTTYGFGSNAGHVYDLANYSSPVSFTVFDSGGTDTFNFSLYSTDQTINLNAETISDIGGAKGNIGIARDVTIENAIGGFGDDVIEGNAVNNILRGEAGNDVLNGNDGNDILLGGAGQDVFDGGAGTDRAAYWFASSGVIVDLGNISNNAGEAQGDTYISIENMQGSYHADILTGDASNNWIWGLGGYDTISGSFGDDVIFGENGNDTLNGDSGADRLFGNDGNDALDGGDGDDILIGGAGADALNGGSGIDRAAYWDADSGITADLENATNNTGIAQGDTYSSVENLQGSNHADVLIGDAVDNSIWGGNGNDFVSGQDGNDHLYGDDGSDTLNGDDGDDRLFGGNGNDVLNGGANNDILLGGSGDNILDGGSGVDRAAYWDATSGLTADLGNTSNNTGFAQNDTYISIEGLQGSNFADTLYGDTSDNSLWGFGGNDIIWGQTGNDVIYGENGNDVLQGGGGNDMLFGGNGTDQLEGGAGDDTLIGGSDNVADTFIFDGINLGNDLIVDFQLGTDVMQVFANTGIVNFTELQSYTSQQDDDTLISWENGGAVLLAGVDLAGLQSSDFQFA